MSYILDALKKADAEREQGQVPGLHTHAGHPDTEEGPLLRTPPPWLMGLGGLLVLVALGAVGWQWTRPMAAATVTAPQSLASSAAQIDQSPAPTPPVPVIATVPTQTHVADPVPGPASTASEQPEVQAAASPPRSDTARPTAETTRTLPQGRPTRPELAVTLPGTSATPRAPVHVDPATTPASANKVPTLAELPDEVRRTLPPLTVSGAMYSDSPANRMLLINNRVFHEGDQPVAGLVLEEIRLKSAVFRYRGTRYAVSY